MLCRGAFRTMQQLKLDRPSVQCLTERTPTARFWVSHRAVDMPQTSRVESCRAHIASGNISRIDPMNSAEVQKSNVVIPTLPMMMIPTTA
jgi:hypothetical protein